MWLLNFCYKIRNFILSIPTDILSDIFKSRVTIVNTGLLFDTKQLRLIFSANEIFYA